MEDIQRQEFQEEIAEEKSIYGKAWWEYNYRNDLFHFDKKRFSKIEPTHKGDIYSIFEVDRIVWGMMTPPEKAKLVTYKNLGDKLEREEELTEGEYQIYLKLMDWVVDEEIDETMVRD